MKYFAEEVIQTSSMDCGPACLASVARGFGISVDYSRVRQMCRTEVDGTSIEALEEVASSLGFAAEQVMVPFDHLFSPAVEAFPSIAVSRLPNNSTHFVVLWKKIGRWVQVMDPAYGRAWLTHQELKDTLLHHTHEVEKSDWLEWTRSEGYQKTLQYRLNSLGCDATMLPWMPNPSVDYGTAARFDAAVRFASHLSDHKGLRRGRRTATLLKTLFFNPALIPESFWSVRPHQDVSTTAGDADKLVLRGVVLLRIALGDEIHSQQTQHRVDARQNQVSTVMRLWNLATQAAGRLPHAALIGAVCVAAIRVGESVLFRSFIDIWHRFDTLQQRLGGLVAMSVVLLFALGFESVMHQVATRIGANMELSLRLDILKRLPSFSDQYFRSRPTSDMTERCHQMHIVRDSPRLMVRLVTAVAEIAFVCAGIAWLEPAFGVHGLVIAAILIAIPVFFHKWLSEKDHKLGTHEGTLSLHYLDALLGMVSVRAHSAESALRRKHLHQLQAWKRAHQELGRATLLTDALTFVFGYGCGLVLLMTIFTRHTQLGAALLLIFWVFRLPVLGHEIGRTLRIYPELRTRILRIFELLDVNSMRVDHGLRATQSPVGVAATTGGAVIEFSGVSVMSAGHVLLHGIDLTIDGGDHVAVVGQSGSGKSSLVNTLLGWNDVVDGAVRVDGQPLDEQSVRKLRKDTVWISPDVHLFDRSVLDNLMYGQPPQHMPPIADVLRLADLEEVLQLCEDGLQTRLGESGWRVSGGQGQRVRIGRGLGRPHARLVVLDEPFRGLERARRDALIRAVRAYWKQATLLYVTHDIEHVGACDRVLCLENATVVDRDLTMLIDAQKRTREQVWIRFAWNRIELEHQRQG